MGILACVSIPKVPGWRHSGKRTDDFGRYEFTPEQRMSFIFRRIRHVPDTRDNFYPDFVIATELRGAVRPQLVETKYDERDIRKKQGRVPSRSYGRVVFVTTDGADIHLVTDEGTIGPMLSNP